MRKDLEAIAAALHARHATDEEIVALRRHAQAVAASASTAEQLKDKEYSIVHAAMGELYKKWPDKRTAFRSCEEKTLRDMKLVMRYCLYSAVLDDPDYAKDRMLFWFRTILNAFEFGHEFIEDAYRMAQKRVNQQLGKSEAESISYMIDESIAVFNG